MTDASDVVMCKESF